MWAAAMLQQNFGIVVRTYRIYTLVNILCKEEHGADGVCMCCFLAFFV